METKIQSLHFKAGSGLRERIMNEAEKLEKLHGRIQDCTVTLKLDKDNQHQNKTVEINLNVPGRRLFCEDKSETFETAADLAFSEMQRQLRKYKTGLENRRPHDVESE